MKRNIIYLATLALILFQACALNEADLEANVEDFPFRLQIDEKGADLPDAEDYDAKIEFADFIGDLPSSEIQLSYELSGSDDFTNVTIDEIIYEYETDDCVYEREIAFTDAMIMVPVDPDLGTVPVEFEVKFAFNLAGEEASDGGFEFTLTDILTDANVVLNAISTFEYEILDNDLAGEWVSEITSEEEFDAFKDAFGPISPELDALTFAEITGEVKYEFDVEELKMEIELVETEVVTECKDDEIETEEKNKVVEIKAEYKAEDGELELEGKYINEDGEELDFIIETAYDLPDDETRDLNVEVVIDKDNFAEGEELFTGDLPLTLIKD